MLKAEQLVKRFEDTVAVNGLELEVKAGEIYCLLGPNGAGKTTTVHLFMGFLKPDSGTVKVGGIDVFDHQLEARKRLSYIPEQLALYPNLTGHENLEFFSSLGSDPQGKEALEQLLKEAGLQESAIHRKVSGYSKGMRQKVGIAIALAKNSKALILDEPTSGLDPEASNEFARLLVGLSEKGVAILMTTHDLFRARETGTRIGIMREGVLKREFKAGDVKHDELENVYLNQMRLSE